jgi:hypothetical protein
MGYALIWIEALAAALFALALAAAWAGRGRLFRTPWVALVWLTIAGPTAFVTYAAWNIPISEGGPIRTTWFTFLLTWLVGFGVGSALVVFLGLRRPEVGLARLAAGWPRRRLWLGISGSVLALGLTIWNMDLAERADLAIARQEAGAVLLTMTQPPVPEAENAARVYDEAIKELGDPPLWLRDAVGRGLDAYKSHDWNDPALVVLVKKHEHVLGLLRKAAATPRCNFERPRTLMSAMGDIGPIRKLVDAGVPLLALEARQRAAAGDLARAFDDIAAIIGLTRHVATEFWLTWGSEVTAWRTLEEVLHVAPAGKVLPTVHLPELHSLARKVREEHVLLGIVFPAMASQPSLLTNQLRQKFGPFAMLLIEALVVPSRVFVVPDDVIAMRRLFDEYQRSPHLERDETPHDWAELRKSVETDPTSYFGAFFIKPKQRMLLATGENLVALRATARAALAVEMYRHKHGKPPERLEQLVPESLPALPVDPRDGQPLRIKRVGDELVIFAPQDEQSIKSRDRESRFPAPVFRLKNPSPSPPRSGEGR